MYWVQDSEIIAVEDIHFEKKIKSLILIVLFDVPREKFVFEIYYKIENVSIWMLLNIYQASTQREKEFRELKSEDLSRM